MLLWYACSLHTYCLDEVIISLPFRWPNSLCHYTAGGHLAALAGTSGEVPDLEDRDMGNAEFSSSVQAAVAWFGPMQFSTMDQELAVLVADGICPASAVFHGEPDSGESKLVRCAVAEPS